MSYASEMRTLSSSYQGYDIEIIKKCIRAAAEKGLMTTNIGSSLMLRGHFTTMSIDWLKKNGFTFVEHDTLFSYISVSW